MGEMQSCKPFARELLAWKKQKKFEREATSKREREGKHGNESCRKMRKNGKVVEGKAGIQ